MKAEYGVVTSVNPGGCSGYVRMAGKVNSIPMPFTGQGCKGDKIPVVLVHNDRQQPIGILPQNRIKQLRSSPAVYTPLWAHIKCSKEHNPYFIFNPIPDFSIGQSVADLNYWTIDSRGMPNYNYANDIGTDTGNFGGDYPNSTGYQSGCRIAKRVNGNQTELAIWSTGYLVYCYDLTNEALLWSHTISGFEDHGVLGNDDGVVSSCNASPATAFVLCKDFIAVLVTRLKYTMFQGFEWDCDPGGTGMTVPIEFAPWTQYNEPVKSYLYLIDYNGNYLGTVDLWEEDLGDWGRPSAQFTGGGWWHDIIQERTWPAPANGMYYVPPDDPGPDWNPMFLEAPTDGAIYPEQFTYEPEYEFTEEGALIHRRYDETVTYTVQNDFSGSQGHIQRIYVHYYKEQNSPTDADPDHNLINTFSTRSSFSPLVVRAETDSVEHLYVNRSGYNTGSVYVKHRLMGSPEIADGALTKQITYNVNLGTKLLINTYEGMAGSSFMWGDLTPAATVHLWDYHPDSGYGLMAINIPGTGFRVVSTSESIILGSEEYLTNNGIELLSVFTIDNRDFAWVRKHDGSKWTIAVVEFGNNCLIWNSWLYTYDREDATFLCGWKSVNGSAIIQHLAYTKGANWGQFTFDMTDAGTLTSVYYSVLSESIYSSYSDGTNIYLLLESGQLKRYLCSNGTYQPENEQTLIISETNEVVGATKEVRTSSQWVMGLTAFYAVGVQSNSIWVDDQWLLTNLKQKVRRVK